MARNHLSQAYKTVKGSPKNHEVDYALEEETQATLYQTTPASLKHLIDTNPAKLLHLLVSLCHNSNVRDKQLSDSYDHFLKDKTSQAEKH